MELLKRFKNILRNVGRRSINGTVKENFLKSLVLIFRCLYLNFIGLNFMEIYINCKSLGGLVVELLVWQSRGRWFESRARHNFIT